MWRSQRNKVSTTKNFLQYLSFTEESCNISELDLKGRKNHIPSYFTGTPSRLKISYQLRSKVWEPRNTYGPSSRLYKVDYTILFIYESEGNLPSDPCFLM